MPHISRYYFDISLFEDNPYKQSHEGPEITLLELQERIRRLNIYICELETDNKRLQLGEGSCVCRFKSSCLPQENRGMVGREEKPLTRERCSDEDLSMCDSAFNSAESLGLTISRSGTKTAQAEKEVLESKRNLTLNDQNCGSMDFGVEETLQNTDPSSQISCDPFSLPHLPIQTLQHLALPSFTSAASPSLIQGNGIAD